MKLLRTAGALLLAGLTTAACTGPGAPAREPTPTPEPSASTSGDPNPAPSPSLLPLSAGHVSTDGLTVRYQGGDGRIKTLRVEDFRR